MRLYHGTTPDRARRILLEGLVREGWCTYLTPHADVAKRFGDVVLTLDVPDGMRLTTVCEPDDVWEWLCWERIAPDYIGLLQEA